MSMKLSNWVLPNDYPLRFFFHGLKWRTITYHGRKREVFFDTSSRNYIFKQSQKVVCQLAVLHKLE